MGEIIKALRTKGYSVREAKRICSLVFSIWKKELLKGTSIELPHGYIQRLPENRKKYRRWNRMRNEPESVYKHKYRVIFKPKEDISGIQ